jgi:putative ABC transport system permease protein
VMIETQTQQIINNIRVKKDSFGYLQYQDLGELQSEFQDRAKAMLFTQHNAALERVGDATPVAAVVTGIAPDLPATEVLKVGRKFSPSDQTNQAKVAIVSDQLAQLLAKKSAVDQLIGQQIRHQQEAYTIIGVLKPGKTPAPTLFVPISSLPAGALAQSPPMCILEANVVEDVPKIKTATEVWLKKHFPSKHQDFQVISNEFRVDQVAKGFLLFRIVMGMIVGISVLVGGIGVMNVLLISVTERTREIGVRKALGAKKRDIMRLFLSESITVSFLGSLMGLGLGILGTSIFIPIVKAITKAPFQAAYTWNTLIVIVVIALLIGVIFGTFPAIKAARLNPVDAIRHE